MHKEAGLLPPPPLCEWTAQHPIALFLDFDGTLVEIADTPGSIHVPDGLARRLEALSARLDARLALVSGRALADIRGHLGEHDIMTVGSHGAEFRGEPAPPLALSDATATAIATLSAQWPTLLVETKPHGVAIHYRQEPLAEPTVLSVMDGIAAKEGLAVRRGKMVIELGPGQTDKGQAVVRLMTRPPFVGAVPVFVGDDVTDEDGFAAAAAAGGCGILVGASRPTAAHYRLGGTQEVFDWLNL